MTNMTKLILCQQLRSSVVDLGASSGENTYYKISTYTKSLMNYTKK